MAIKHEAELYAPLKAFFELNGYEVKGEVRNCDLVGMKEGADEPLIVELKKPSIWPFCSRASSG